MTRTHLIWIGNITYIISLCLAALWYQERTAFLDQAFHLFYLLKDGEFIIQNHRIVAYFTQVFPLVAQRLISDFSIVAMSYSLSFVIINMIYFNLLLTWDRSLRYPLMLLSFNQLLVAHTFFWTQSELPQTLSLMIVFYSLVDLLQRDLSEIKGGVALAAAIIILIITGFSHPLMIIPFAFMGFYLWYSTNISLKSFVLTAVGIGIIYFIKFSFFATQYDAGSMEGIKNFKHLFPDYIHLATNKVFLKMVVFDHSLYWILSIASVVYLLYRKAIFPVLLLGVATIGYVLLINVSYPDNAEAFYLENLYQPLSIFLLTILLFDKAFAKILIHRMLPAAIILLFAYQLGQKLITSFFYKERLEYLKMVRLDDSCGKYAILEMGKLDKRLIMMPWASSYEFWVIGNLEHDLSRAKIISNPHFHFCGYTEVLITQWGNVTGDDLKKPFFQFTNMNGYQCCHAD